MSGRSFCGERTFCGAKGVVRFSKTAETFRLGGIVRFHSGAAEDKNHIFAAMLEYRIGTRLFAFKALGLFERKLLGREERESLQSKNEMPDKP